MRFKITCQRSDYFCKLNQSIVHRSTFLCNRKLKGEVKTQRDETMSLRKALQECKACKIKKPECGDDPPPCFPRVECRDTYDGPVCGPCPQGFKGDGRVRQIILFKLLLRNYDLL